MIFPIAPAAIGVRDLRSTGGVVACAGADDQVGVNGSWRGTTTRPSPYPDGVNPTAPAIPASDIIMSSQQ